MLPRKTPQSGGLRDNWTFFSTPAGEWWLAYLAGHPWWYECHRVNSRSKPCLTRLTDGALTCPWCGSGEPYWWGYCPLYREADHRPVLVGLRVHSQELLSKVGRCSRVKVARADGPGEGCTVVPYGTERYQTARPDRQSAPDLSAVLLRLWAIPDLTSWHAAREREQGAAVADIVGPQPAAAVPPSAGPASPIDRNEEFVRSVRAGRVPSTVGEILPPTGLNGIHPKG